MQRKSKMQRGKKKLKDAEKKQNPKREKKNTARIKSRAKTRKTLFKNLMHVAVCDCVSRGAFCR